MADSKPVSVERLKQLEPLSNLSQERLEELVALAYCERFPIGASLFREGDIDNQMIYLLEGDVQLSSSDGKVDRLFTHRHAEAIFPIDDSQPRQISCTAMSRVEIIRIDNSVLDYMMMWDQMAASEEAEQEANSEAEPAPDTSSTPVAEEHQEPATVSSDQAAETVSVESVMPKHTVPADEDRSWIRKMRHIMAFKNMPPANIKALLEKMETILVEEDDVIVQQGEPGDYYYVLTEGEARVTRVVELASLGPGASFGEEALVSGVMRNASVTMKTDGMLMRLSKANFNELLKDPLVDRISPDDAREQINKGAIWLDVRHAKEFAHNHLAKAINIPLHEMRIRLGELDKDQQYICYCSTGRRSSAAAFLLVQRGFQANVLNGGIQVMAQDLINRA